MNPLHSASCFCMSHRAIELEEAVFFSPAMEIVKTPITVLEIVENIGKEGVILVPCQGMSKYEIPHQIVCISVGVIVLNMQDHRIFCSYIKIFT